MDIKDLMNVKFTTLSKREETYMSTAGAVFVISSDDIRRSGMRNIPDLLRMVPGLQVSQSNMNQFVVGSRGQTDFWSDLLLVMVDGRPVYSTTFSGVWWVAQNYPLEEIEQIEVVRGPGGALWGSNATNGVINIITRHAGTSPGLRISSGAGTEDKGFGNISYASNNGNLDYRLYGMSEYRDGGLSTGSSANYPIGTDMPDSRHMNQQGFRLDWDAAATTKITLHGDAYHMQMGQTGYWVPTITPGQGTAQYTGSNHLRGQNLVFNQESELTPAIKFKTQLFYDQTKVDTLLFHENKVTVNGDLQIDLSDVWGQDISLGSGVRNVKNTYANTPQLQLQDRTTKLYTFFINDELSFLDAHMRLIGGLKMEQNSYTRWENQPSVRAVYADETWALWTAASRSVRIPNDSEKSALWNIQTVNNPAAPALPILARTIGNGQVTTEKVTTYEIGGRMRPTEQCLVEATLFKTYYKGVPESYSRPAAMFIDKGIPVLPVYITNLLNGEGHGAELNFRYQPQYRVKLKGSYTYLQQQYYARSAPDAATLAAARKIKSLDPAHRFHAGASFNVSSNVEFDANYYFTGSFREGSVPANRRLDLRLGWKPEAGLEISLAGQNLLQARHQENLDNARAYASFIQRRYYLQASYHLD